MTYPYNDDNMVFDESTGRYKLTERAISHIGMRARLSKRRGTDATTIINRLLDRVSEMVYDYIHKFNHDNKGQDYIIANAASARPIIYRAMLNQVEYYLLNGDISRSVDLDKRKLAIDETVKGILNTTITEVGAPITYAGAWR